jgi:hypothetical protein
MLFFVIFFRFSCQNNFHSRIVQAISARLQRIQANIERLRSAAPSSVGSSGVALRPAPRLPAAADDDEEALVTSASASRALPDLELSIDIPSLCIKVGQ